MTGVFKLVRSHAEFDLICNNFHFNTEFRKSDEARGSRYNLQVDTKQTIFTEAVKEEQKKETIKINQVLRSRLSNGFLL